MTFSEARDIILTVFTDVWPYPVEWTDVPGSAPATETVWARVTLRHSTAGQATLSDENGARRWRRTGTLFVQIFAPIGDGEKALYDAAQTVVNAYEDARNTDVWFRDPRINEDGQDGSFEQLNVLVTFTYDDVR